MTKSRATFVYMRHKGGLLHKSMRPCVNHAWPIVSRASVIHLLQFLPFSGHIKEIELHCLK